MQVVPEEMAMTLRRTLDVMAATLSRASSVPLSASCMVNRAEMLSLVERAKAELPAELDEAAALLVAHQEVVEAAERDREQLLADARDQVEDMLTESAVVATAQQRAEQILDAARSEAARLLREADDYCEAKLGDFEADLQRLVGQVGRGRDRLRERSDLAALREPSLSTSGSLSGSPSGSLSGSPGDVPFDGEARETLTTYAGAGDDGLPVQAGPDRVIDLAGLEAAAELDGADLGSR